MKSFVVIGLGRFGTRVAEKLYELGEDVLAIDTKESLVNNIADRVTSAVVADAKDKAVLKSLGVQDCDCAIVAMGTNLAASVLITMNLKTLGVPKIICKAHDDTHREILEKLGADRVIIPEREVAEKTARMLSSPNIFEYIDLSEDYGIFECTVPKPWAGKTIRELGIRSKYDTTIIAVKEQGRIKLSPGADYKIEAGAVLVLLGDYDRLDQIKNIK